MGRFNYSSGHYTTSRNRNNNRIRRPHDRNNNRIRRPHDIPEARDQYLEQDAPQELAPELLEPASNLPDTIPVPFPGMNAPSTPIVNEQGEEFQVVQPVPFPVNPSGYVSPPPFADYSSPIPSPYVPTGATPPPPPPVQPASPQTPVLPRPVSLSALPPLTPPNISGEDRGLPAGRVRRRLDRTNLPPARRLFTQSPTFMSPPDSPFDLPPQPLVALPPPPSTPSPSTPSPSTPPNMGGLPLPPGRAPGPVNKRRLNLTNPAAKRRLVFDSPPSNIGGQAPGTPRVSGPARRRINLPGARPRLFSESPPVMSTPPNTGGQSLAAPRAPVPGNKRRLNLANPAAKRPLFTDSPSPPPPGSPGSALLASPRTPPQSPRIQPLPPLPAVIPRRRLNRPRSQTPPPGADRYLRQTPGGVRTRRYSDNSTPNIRRYQRRHQ